MRYRYFHAALACVLLLAACATDPIEIAGNAKALPALRTFKVQEERYAFPEQITDEQRRRVSAELRRAAVDALEGRGYQEVTGDTAPDVLVVLGAVGRTTLAPATEAELNKHIRPVDTSVFDASAGSAPAGAAANDRPTGVGREGDLILYLLDPVTQRALWRANANGSASSAGEALRKARSTYRAMAKRLPEAGSGTK